MLQILRKSFDQNQCASQPPQKLTLLILLPTPQKIINSKKPQLLTLLHLTYFMSYSFASIHETNKSKSQGIDPINVHFLPFQINQDGEAKVKEYFESIIEDTPPTSNQEQRLLKTSLYGRELIGKEIKIPDGVQVHAFSRNSANPQKIKFIENNQCLLHVWGHDEVPLNSNQVQASIAYLQAMSELASDD